MTFKEDWTHNSQNVVTEQSVMIISEPARSFQSRLTESETLVMGPSNLCFHESSGECNAH